MTKSLNYPLLWLSSTLIYFSPYRKTLIVEELEFFGKVMTHLITLEVLQPLATPLPLK